MATKKKTTKKSSLEDRFQDLLDSANMLLHML